MKQTLTSTLTLALLVLAVAGTAAAAQPAAEGAVAATLQQAPEPLLPLAAPAAANPEASSACHGAEASPAPLFVHTAAAASCDLPLQGCNGYEVEYCECIEHNNPLYCYKVWCM